MPIDPASELRAKLLAHAARETDTRTAMERQQSLSHRLIAASALAAYLCTLAFCALPEMHECIHTDAGTTHHQCAVTLIAAGNVELPSATSLLVAPALAPQFAEVQTSNTRWVQSLFLGACILEHAPPLHS